MQKMIKVKLVRSAAGRIPKHRKTIECLGLRKINDEKTIIDNPQTRGMVKAVCHLVKIIDEKEAAKS